MNPIDKHILALLQLDSQISNQDLADRVHLSPSPCSRRVKQLFDEGYITRQVALLNPEKLGLHLTILVLVGLDNHLPESLKQFESAIRAMPEVIQCYLITGQSQDYLLKVIVPDLEHYQAFLLKKLTVIPGVDNVHSSFVLQSIIDNTALPLDHL